MKTIRTLGATIITISLAAAFCGCPSTHAGETLPSESPTSSPPAVPGWTWYTRENTGGMSQVYPEVRSVMVSGSTIYAGTYYGLYVSTDGGATWTNSTKGDGLGSNAVYGIAALGSSIYAATSGGLSVSTNGGSSWTDFAGTDGLVYSIVQGVAVSGSNVYVAS